MDALRHPLPEVEAALTAPTRDLGPLRPAIWDYVATTHELVVPLYELDEPIASKIETIATRVYGANGVSFMPAAVEKMKRYTETGLGELPICMAKTHLSLSHDPLLVNAPKGFTVPIRDLRAYTGAGWIVALCGDMMTMPGLSATPALQNVDIDASGTTVGLF